MSVLVITYWSYKDALIQSYTLPYVKLIQNHIAPQRIYLVTIENPFHKMDEQQWQEEYKKLEQEGIELIRFKYDHFGLKMMLRFLNIIPQLYKLIKRKNIQHIHCWCMTAGGMGYILSKLTKRKLIIDSYEPHAESMVENGTWTKASFKYKLLFWLEKKQSKRAETVIALTKGMKDYAKDKYNAVLKNYYIKPAMVNLEKFKWNKEEYLETRKQKQLTDKIVGIYAGKLGGIYLEEEVLDFIKTASEYWGDKFKFYLLTNKNKKEVEQMANQKSIPSSAIEIDFIPYQRINKYYQLADFAINPVKPVPSKKYCTSIKDGEYWAMGLPVIITKNISDDSDIIKEQNIGYVLDSLTTEEYMNACKTIEKLNKNTEELRTKVRAIAENKRSFEIANQIYQEIYS